MIPRTGSLLLLHPDTPFVRCVSRYGNAGAPVEELREEELAVLLSDSIDPPAIHVYALTQERACWVELADEPSANGTHRVEWEPR